MSFISVENIAFVFTFVRAFKSFLCHSYFALLLKLNDNIAWNNLSCFTSDVRYIYILHIELCISILCIFANELSPTMILSVKYL